MEMFYNWQCYRHGIPIKTAVIQIIDETETVKRYGYTSDSLAPQSGKPIVAVCDVCGLVRVVRKDGYRELCQKCSCKGRVISDTTRRKISEANMGHPVSEEARQKISESNKGRKPPNFGTPMPEEQKQKISKALKGKYGGENSHWFGKKHTEESKRRISATKQGIDVSEWESFALEHSYCYLFDDDCRERNRDRYGRRCFICGKPESENFTRAGKQKKLAVHHVDMNKQQGCEDPEWSLVPLCIEHHNPAHTELWRARIEYLLQNVYTDGKCRTWVQ